MRLAIMQPYLFPYIGYFQLMNAVDRFVLYDDVQFIKEGWIHRNRVLSGGKSMTFTVPLTKASHADPICNRTIARQRWLKDRKKLLTTIHQNYRKAPHYESTIGVIESALNHEDPMLANFIQNALLECGAYQEIDTDIVSSSTLNLSPEASGQERIIAMCGALGADEYINAIGGIELYDRAAFDAQGIKLSFIKSRGITYRQFNNEFIPWLSIIDVMMFNPLERIQEFLNEFDLV